MLPNASTLTFRTKLVQTFEKSTSTVYLQGANKVSTLSLSGTTVAFARNQIKVPFSRPQRMQNFTSYCLLTCVCHCWPIQVLVGLWRLQPQLSCCIGRSDNSSVMVSHAGLSQLTIFSRNGCIYFRHQVCNLLVPVDRHHYCSFDFTQQVLLSVK